MQLWRGARILQVLAELLHQPLTRFGIALHSIYNSGVAGKKIADSLVRRFSTAIGRQQWCNPGDRVAIAVSGGADSAALLLLMAEAAPAHGLQLAVAHYDHGWRRESGNDAAFVADLASALQIPFHSARAGEAPERDREQQARRARYDFFTNLIRDGRADAVATAHTADDQAETVLLRLLRGTGPPGLAGILPRRADGIVRPLLAFRRAALRAWLASRHQSWREDPSNLDLHHRRNLLRQRFLPELASAFNPALVERLALLAEVARGEEEFWAAAVLPLWQQLWQPGGAGGSFSRRQLAAQPLALQRRLLRFTVRHLQGDVRHLEGSAIEQLVAWVGDSAVHPRRGRLARLQFRLSAHSLDIQLGG